MIDQRAMPIGIWYSSGCSKCRYSSGCMDCNVEMYSLLDEEGGEEGGEEDPI